MNKFDRCQAIYDNREHPDYYDDCEFTEDEIEEARLELQIERLEARERGDW